MEPNEGRAAGPQDPGEGHGLANILKVLFLIAVLVGAWFLLDWLISGTR